VFIIFKKNEKKLDIVGRFVYFIYIMNDLAELRKTFKKFIFERDMRLEVASEFFGLSIGTISGFINGRQNLNQRNQYKIRKLMGLVND